MPKLPERPWETVEIDYCGLPKQGVPRGWVCLLDSHQASTEEVEESLCHSQSPQDIPIRQWSTVQLRRLQRLCSRMEFTQKNHATTSQSPVLNWPNFSLMFSMQMMHVLICGCLLCLFWKNKQLINDFGGNRHGAVAILHASYQNDQIWFLAAKCCSMKIELLAGS